MSGCSRAIGKGRKSMQANWWTPDLSEQRARRQISPPDFLNAGCVRRMKGREGERGDALWFENLLKGERTSQTPSSSRMRRVGKMYSSELVWFSNENAEAYFIIIRISIRTSGRIEREDVIFKQGLVYPIRRGRAIRLNLGAVSVHHERKIIGEREAKTNRWQTPERTKRGTKTERRAKQGGLPPPTK